MLFFIRWRGCRQVKTATKPAKHPCHPVRWMGDQPSGRAIVVCVSADFRAVWQRVRLRVTGAYRRLAQTVFVRMVDRLSYYSSARFTLFIKNGQALDRLGPHHHCFSELYFTQSLLWLEYDIHSEGAKTMRAGLCRKVLAAQRIIIAQIDRSNTAACTRFHIKDD